MVAFRIFPVLILACAAIAGCTAEPPKSDGASSGKKLLGVTLFYRQDEFYKDLESGVRDAAAALGYELLVSDAETQVVKQASQVDNFIRARVAGMILCCADPNGIIPAIERANEAKIPVVTLDGSANGGQVVSYVGHDNAANGRAAGEFLVKYAQSRPGSEPLGVVILDYPKSATVCAARVEGFKKAVAGQPRIRIVAQQDGEANRAASFKVMSSVLQASPQIDAVFGINDNTVLGAMAAAESAGRAEGIRFISVSWSSEAFELLEKPSSLAAAVVTNPYEMGYKAVQCLVDHLDGKETPKQVLLEPAVYTHENVKQLDWRSVVQKRK